MSGKQSRTAAALALGLCVFFGSGCMSQPEGHAHDSSAAESVTMTNGWARPAEAGMMAVFGTFTNRGPREARIVGGSSPLAGTVELREVAPDATGTMIMRPGAGGGLALPAGEVRELIPGGDHLMLMDLKQPLQSGADIPLTVFFDDGSTLPALAQVRGVADANEHRSPAGETGGVPHHH